MGSRQSRCGFIASPGPLQSIVYSLQPAFPRRPVPMYSIAEWEAAGDRPQVLAARVFFPVACRLQPRPWVPSPPVVGSGSRLGRRGATAAAPIVAEALQSARLPPRAGLSQAPSPPGRAASWVTTLGKNRTRQFCTYGSAPGAVGNRPPYREPADLSFALLHSGNEQAGKKSLRALHARERT